MLREIINIFAGRKKVVDVSMGFSEIQDILAKLDETTKISGEFVSFGDHKNYTQFNSAAPEKINEIVKKEFQPNSNKYFEATHQVFSDDKKEKHYINLQTGKIIKCQVINYNTWKREEFSEKFVMKDSAGMINEELTKSMLEGANGKPYAKVNLEYTLETQK